MRRQRNDRADAEAIVVAAQRAEMRFVAPKTADQKAWAVLFRGREWLVHQRTELVNAPRAALYEYTVPQATGHIQRIEVILDEPHSDLPALVCEECRDLLAQITEKTVRIDKRTSQIKTLAAETDTAHHLQTMPGVGPMTALAVEACAPEMTQFRRGRDFAELCPNLGDTA